MKRQIRRGVFETNSSSMHSVVVLKEDIEKNKNDYFNVYLNSRNKLNPYKNELSFGRSPFDSLTNFKDKVYYAIASLCAYKHENWAENFNKIEQVVIHNIKNCKGIELEEVVRREEDEIITEYYYGYVDEDILSGFLKKENITIEEFLVNPQYVVIVDGDEYCVYNKMKDAGLINQDTILREYPNYKEW